MSRSHSPLSPDVVLAAGSATDRHFTSQRSAHYWFDRDRQRAAASRINWILCCISSFIAATATLLGTHAWLLNNGSSYRVTSDLNVDGRVMAGREQVDLLQIIPPGAVFDWSCVSNCIVPPYYLLCDGAAVDRVAYRNLFAVIGTYYGIGNGVSTFNLPDTRGRVSMGAGTGVGLTTRTPSTLLGEETHTLSVAEMPAHGHPVTPAAGSFVVYGAGGTPYPGNSGGFYLTVASASAGSTGSGTPHNNIQPSIVFTKIIKT